MPAALRQLRDGYFISSVCMDRVLSITSIVAVNKQEMIWNDVDMLKVNLYQLPQLSTSRKRAFYKGDI